MSDDGLLNLDDTLTQKTQTDIRYWCRNGQSISFYGDHDPRSRHDLSVLDYGTEMWWTPILGCTSLTLARRVGTWLMREEKVRLATPELARYLGVEAERLSKTLIRLTSFGRGTWREGEFTLRMWWEPVPERWHKHLPRTLVESIPSRTRQETH